MQSHILHVTSKSHPLWQVHAKSHLTRHIKIQPPLASTCKVTSYTSHQSPTPLASTCKVTSCTSYQTPTSSDKYMQSHILHVISKSHSLWQVHKKSHLTRHIKIPLPLASTCKVTSYTSYQIPTPSGQVDKKSHLTRHIKIPLPLASTCKVKSYTSYQNPNPLWQVYAKSHLTRHIKIPPPLASTCESHLTRHIKVPPPLASTCEVKLLPPLASTCKGHGLRNIVYESWFTEADVNQRKDVQMPNSFVATTRIQQGTCRLS